MTRDTFIWMAIIGAIIYGAALAVKLIEVGFIK